MKSGALLTLEYIIGGWPWQIFGAIRAVATAGEPGEIVLSGKQRSPVAGPITLVGPLTIVSLLFSIVLSVSMKFSPGGRSPPAWLFQNPR